MTGTRLLVIVGPTGAGKTRLGVEVAERLRGEVISADAFAVYRGMDIGTAKPSLPERRGIPHHLLDIVEPIHRYSAGDFVRDADAAIADVCERGRRPVVVGGTHFYVRALLWGLFPEPPKDPDLRALLEEEWRRDAASVRRELEEVDPETAAAVALGDRQRTLRALEVFRVSGCPISLLRRRYRMTRPRYPYTLIGLHVPRADLRDRISERVRNMFFGGLIEEVRRLLALGLSPEAHALRAIGYRECMRVLSGEWTETEARERTETATSQLAKRQLTWLRGEQDLVWLHGPRKDWTERVVEMAEGCGGSGF